MNKTSVAIAHALALPSAFVVFRGFEESIITASELGYNGVELALRSANEIDVHQLDKLLSKAKLEVSAISTGQIFAERGFSFTSVNQQIRDELHKTFYGLIRLASEFGKKVNIGRVRGFLSEGHEKECMNLFTESMMQICEYALKYNVDILLEPINRYETNFINNVEDASEIVKRLKIENLFIMPDLFHMNIEDSSIENSLAKHIDKIKYIHLADSNRLAPGMGHLDFDSIFATLQKTGYDGWLTMEILPNPTPVLAASEAIKTIKRKFKVE
jgi:sugar phosphate isomerase/epimerase